MQWALDDTGERITASPGARAQCPCCQSPVIAKCGEIICWHWAHESLEDCDSWSEGETEWHLGWKSQFPKDWQEVVVRNHRADIMTPRFVLELQNSPISKYDIWDREVCYSNEIGRMVWLINGAPFWKNFHISSRGEYSTFRWKWPRQSWWSADHPIYIDFGLNNGMLFKIGRLYKTLPCRGWGKWITIKHFHSICANYGKANSERTAPNVVPASL